MDIQANIDEGRVLVKTLLEKPPVEFTRGSLDIPDESGIYAFSAKGEERFLYVGQSTKGLKSRMTDHWAGAGGADLSCKLRDKGKFGSLSDAKKWIRKNVCIQYLTSTELEWISHDLNITLAEHFAIAVLRPTLNK